MIYRYLDLPKGCQMVPFSGCQFTILLGFKDGTPLEAAGKNVIFIICGWDSPNRKMLFIIVVVFFHPGRGVNMVEFSFCSHVKSRINQLEVSSSMYD